MYNFIINFELTATFTQCHAINNNIDKTANNIISLDYYNIIIDMSLLKPATLFY